MTSLPKKLKEVSAIEVTSASNILWMIEDSNTKNKLYGMNTRGDILKEIKLSDTKNKDWEDLTSDENGNIYVGDFGNNSGKRDSFFIYKITTPDQLISEVTPNIIEFEVPKKYTNKDFEAFFLWNSNFYLFSKEDKVTAIFKIKNQTGKQKATFIGELNLKGKKNPITSAAISDNKKTIALLNHDKIWILTDFNEGDFSNCYVKEIALNHKSQKEGICFKNNNTIYITDEKTVKNTGNLYEFEGL
ncbi:SdiA-regulated domain-containing protein [Aquimarina agarivorans]|uniref:SdiA-regulated domain-containing protein n=1 Tax=Aquimarina agarivorans TaxID=980584 RepID=UPI000248EA22|nr:SdiA-regulated domain-containing protein [Aquimarina agarivorans]